MQHCGNAARDRQTDTQTAVTTIHFASATPHVKCITIKTELIAIYTIAVKFTHDAQ